MGVRKAFPTTPWRWRALRQAPSSAYASFTMNGASLRLSGSNWERSVKLTCLPYTCSDSVTWSDSFRTLWIVPAGSYNVAVTEHLFADLARFRVARARAVVGPFPEQVFLRTIHADYDRP